MANTISITPDANGRAIMTIHGDQYDVTEMADENGKGSVNVFGEDFEFEIVKPKTQRKSKKTEEVPEETDDEKEE